MIDVDAAGYPDAKDVTFHTWKDLKASGTDIDAGSTIYYNEDGDVTHVVVTGLDYADTTDYSALIQRVDVNKDGEITKLVALVDGESKTYTVDNLDNTDLTGVTVAQLVKGSAVILEVNDKDGLVTDITEAVDASRYDEGKITKLAGNKVSVDNFADGNYDGNADAEYELDSKGEVYKALVGDAEKDYKVKTLSDLEVGDTVKVIKSGAGSRYADSIILTVEKTSTPVPPVSEQL